MNEGKRPTALEQALALVSALVVAWSMMPPQERMWARLRMLQLAHRLSGRLAWREGHRGMGDELAGRDLGRYRLACLMSRARDACERAMQEMRL